MFFRFPVLALILGVVAACSSKTTDSADAVIEQDVVGTDVGSGTDAVDATEDVATWQAGRKWPNTQAAAAKGALSAGIAQGYLDSPVGVSMAGYGGRNDGLHSTWCESSKASRGFYGKMTIKTMALQVGTERLVFVKSPLMTSESFLTDAIAMELQTKYGLDLRGRLIMSATHSHHAPARFWPIPTSFGGIGLDTFDPEVTARMVSSFATVIKQSIDDLAPAEWAWSTFEDWDKDDLVYRDRRHENDPQWGKDPRLTVVAVRRPGGEMMASILNFPIHGTAFGGDNDFLTEDAPVAVENKVEEAWFAQTGKPLQAMFMQCAGGDAAPSGDALGHPTPARLEKLGVDAAHLILPHFSTLVWKSEMELAVRTIRVDFDHSNMYAYPDLVHEFEQEDGAPYQNGGWQCKAKNVNPGESMAGKPKLCIDLTTFLGALDVTFPYGPLNQSLLSAARLDGLALITLPGEPTYSLVQYARKQIEGKTTGITSLMVVGYSQDYFLYLTAPTDWMLGGYESEMSLWGPAGGQFFADNSLALLKDIVAGNTQPAFWESSPTLSPPVAFTARAVEKSEDPNTVVQDAPDTVTRTTTFDFVWGGGDSNLGAPTVTLQRQLASAWSDVPAPNGHKGLAYDNSRYEMITIYQPIPEVKSDVLPSRKHHWRVRWEVPADLPLGTYRLVATGNAQGMDGKAVVLAVQSKAFHVGAGDTTFAVKRAGTKLSVTMNGPPTTYAEEAGTTWPLTGWRLLDYKAAANQPSILRTTLHATIQAGGKTTEVDLPFVEADQTAEVDLTPLGLATSALDLTVEVKGSDTPWPNFHLDGP